MAQKYEILGFRNQGAEMLGSDAVREIFTLRRLGWGAKTIAKELGLARNTVRDWLRAGANRVYATPAAGGLLAEHLEWVRERFRVGVRNGDVIRQELLARGVVVSLRTVNRALKPLRRELVLADRATIRFETPPGKQMQVDFGEKWLEIGGVSQKRYVFVATLGYSRRTFAMVFGSMRQRDWIVGMEGAFRHFGGVPQEVLSDNARPLVLRQQGGKAVFHPEFLAFCNHWGVRPRACQPYRARTKGKVENGVGYVKGNALGSLAFPDDATLDQHLVTWMREVADQRLHGTTHERPMERFQRLEREALSPVGAHPSYLRQRHLLRKVAVDARVEVDTNRYSVPGTFLGETVEVVIEADRLQIHWRDRIIAEHEVATGRYQSVEDPSHVAGFQPRTAKATGQNLGLVRDLSVYERVVGGEA
jgi:transposase